LTSINFSTLLFSDVVHNQFIIDGECYKAILISVGEIKFNNGKYYADGP